ncbi:MAG: MBL fold metallo-hydrolase [Actinomycetota bacterium]|nr:MBL fold metallo-hydrolase [Actinomycetota bacterium]
MTHETRRVGRFEITAILDGDFPDEPITDAFPNIPAEALMSAKSAFPGVYTDDDHWQLRIRAWVVRHPQGLVLLDTGIGGATSPSASWAPEPGKFASVLDELGIALGDIDTVAISHVHDDHIGGLLADNGSPLCPNARYLVQRADVEWQRGAAAADTEAAPIWHLLETIEGAGLMEAIDGDHRLLAGAELRHLPGHTPGHQVLVLDDADQRTILAADTWNHPVQLANPDWPSGPDNDHAVAATSRRALLAVLDAHPGTIVAPTHFAEAFGEARKAGGIWTWVPV